MDALSQIPDRRDPKNRDIQLESALESLREGEWVWDRLAWAASKSVVDYQTLTREHGPEMIARLVILNVST